jgi:ATP-dependent RNA helicase DHX8/PRP22
MEDDLARLEELSLVSKVCTELENHLGVGEKDLAEYIISLAWKNETVEKFKFALARSGAEFPDSFVANLLRIIQAMKPKKRRKKVMIFLCCIFSACVFCHSVGYLVMLS